MDFPSTRSVKVHMSSKVRNPSTQARQLARGAGDGDRGANAPGEGLGGWLKHRVTRELDARKNRVLDRLDVVAGTVRKVGEPLRNDSFPALGSLADDAARRIEGVATGLRERDLDELADEVRGFARSRPVAFVGAGLAAGLIAGRFLRSSGLASTDGAPRTTGSGVLRHDGHGGRQRTRNRRAE
jgi:hypothetical protein